MNTKRVSITIVKILFKSVHLELSLLLIDSFFPHSCGCEFLSVGCHCGGSSWKCQPYPLCCRTAGYWPLSECAGDVTRWNCHWWVWNWMLCRLAKLVTLVKVVVLHVNVSFFQLGVTTLQSAALSPWPPPQPWWRFWYQSLMIQLLKRMNNSQ